MHTITRALTLAAPANAPTEFRLFRSGPNPTSKGTIIFDAAAAQSVMAAYRKQGVDLPIDLEHDSLSPDASLFRSDANDARGWFQLALRPDGSLWAINVRFTPDGLQRLANRTQRYISPAVTVDEKGHALSLINCALCAMPATYDAQALVAASRGTGAKPVVTFRAPVNVRARLYQLAARRRTTVTAVLLGALRALDAPASVDASEKLRDLIEALGLDPGASRSAVLRAIGALLDTPVSDLAPNQGPSNIDPSAQGADAPPATLSAHEQKIADRITDPARRARFLQLRSDRRSSRTPRQVKKGTR